MAGCGRQPNVFEPVQPHDVKYTKGRWVIDSYLGGAVQDFLNRLSVAGISQGHIDQVSSVQCVKHIEDHDDVPTVGLTVFTENWGTQVVVNCSYEFRFTEAVLYHELTHALFELNHSEDPKSIHFWQVPTYDEVSDEAAWTAKVDELMEFIARGGDE